MYFEPNTLLSVHNLNSHDSCVYGTVLSIAFHLIDNVVSFGIVCAFAVTMTLIVVSSIFYCICSLTGHDERTDLCHGNEVASELPNLKVT